MRYLLLLLCFVLKDLNVQDKCLTYAQLISAADTRNSKQIADLLSPAGYSLTAEQNGSIILSGNDMSMVTIKHAGDSLVSIEYNFEDSTCAKSFQVEILAAGYTKDFKWSAGKSVSHGYESTSKGLYIYKAIKSEEREEKQVAVDSYMITILPLKSYLEKKDKYKSNQRITIEEY